METVVAFLRQGEILAPLWRLIAWGCVAFLVCLGAAAFLRPSAARRFLSGYVSSRAVNALEAALRFAAGLAFMGVSPETKAPLVAFTFGAFMAATAVAMLFLYGVHQRYAGWATAFAIRILPLFGLLSLGLAALVAWLLV